MAHVLAVSIFAVEPATGAVHSFAKDEEPPEWVYEQAQSPQTWVGGLVPEPVEAEPSAPTDGGPPPHGGPGSGKSAWLQYARANQVAVADDATRDEIVAACEAAGIRTA